MESIKALIITNEFPPHVYDGAGVHLNYLIQELRKLIDVKVRYFGSQSESVKNLDVHGSDKDKALCASCPKELEPAFSSCYHRSVGFCATKIDADLIHCHTWYTYLAGILAKYRYGIPLVLTIHSLELLCPWKREQGDGKYDLSCWLEKKAIEISDRIIVFSKAAKQDVLNNFDVDMRKVRVIYNGIDTNEYSHIHSQEVLDKYGIDKEKPYVLFVGRITPPKGILYLMHAILFIDWHIQVVLCAEAPETKGLEEEMKRIIAQERERGRSVFWIQERVDKKSLLGLYSHAAAFCNPSIYEPFGITNLEAMACETPVVASCIGGIKEVVVPSETGLLVEFETKGNGSFEPANPDQFSKDLAFMINQCVKRPQKSADMAKKSRTRAEEIFNWKTIAQKTVNLYKILLGRDL
ncbi:MAG: glycogen synthase [bacterium]